MDAPAATPSYSLSSRRVADLAGITYRMLDHWCRRGLVSPSVQDSKGPGTRRRFSHDDLRIVWALSHVSPLDRRLVSRALRERPDARYLVLTPGSVAAAGSRDAAAARIGAAPLTTILDLSRAPGG